MSASTGFVKYHFKFTYLPTFPWFLKSYDVVPYDSEKLGLEVGPLFCKAMKSSSLLGPFWDLKFWRFSLLNIKAGWVLCRSKAQTTVYLFIVTDLNFATSLYPTCPLLSAKGIGHFKIYYKPRLVYSLPHFQRPFLSF